MKLLKVMLLLLALLCASKALADGPAGADDSLITPGATVLAYCNSKLFDESSKYFNLEPRKSGRSAPVQLKWKNCRILSEGATKLTGQKVEEHQVAEKTDVEVVLEVDAADKQGKYYPQKYWFLLRNYPIGWQIISYNLIGD